METAREIDRLAGLARCTGEQYAIYVEDLIAQVADALKITVPEISSAEIGAVLMVVADQLAKANADRAQTVSASALTNTMSILGERLFSNDAG